MIRALIFDVDGTLAETEDFHRRAFNLTFSEAGLDWYWDVPLYTRLLAVTGGKERITHFMQERREIRLSERAIADLHQRKTALYAAMIAGGAVTLREGIPELIAEAMRAGHRLAIATTTSLANVEALLASRFGPGWRAVFPIIVAGDMVARKKPAPDVYLEALRQLDLPAGACIALEDSANGIAAARGAGLRVLARASRYLPEDDLSAADRVLAATDVPTLATLRALASPAIALP